MSCEVEMALVRADIVSTDCRWTKVRKGALIRIIGQFPLEAEALKRRFFLSDEELAAWKREGKPT